MFPDGQCRLFGLWCPYIVQILIPETDISQYQHTNINTCGPRMNTLWLVYMMIDA